MRPDTGERGPGERDHSQITPVSITLLIIRFIQEVGKALGLRHDTMATASVYFHRFYMFHSFLEFPRYVTATCALFLAGKAEETPKKSVCIFQSFLTIMTSHFCQMTSHFGHFFYHHDYSFFLKTAMTSHYHPIMIGHYHSIITHNDKSFWSKYRSS